MAHQKTPCERGESCFSKTASPSAARQGAFEEICTIKIVQNEKIRRLREGGLARDMHQDAVASAPPEQAKPKPGFDTQTIGKRNLRTIKKTELAERRGMATGAKAALLQAYQAAQKAAEPHREARQQERLQIAEAREARHAAREQAKFEERARLEADARQREAALATAATAETDARERAHNQRIARVLDDEAMRKALRDQRYAARKARRG